MLLGVMLLYNTIHHSNHSVSDHREPLSDKSHPPPQKKRITWQKSQQKHVRIMICIQQYVTYVLNIQKSGTERHNQRVDE